MILLDRDMYRSQVMFNPSPLWLHYWSSIQIVVILFVPKSSVGVCRNKIPLGVVSTILKFLHRNFRRRSNGTGSYVPI